ncbi:hypothetical protein V6N13_024838 [Hibiscus sabdariffa]|uniref:Uncharacterized protein n=1 Tax=Hibiscus sabdariffa TaxID=183260 RepID=A0ABR2QGZ7_9ROSI
MLWNWVNERLYQVCVQEIESLFRTEVDSNEDECVSEESAGNEEAQHDVLNQVSEIGIEKTPIKTVGVVEESSTTNKLIANKVVRESEGTIVPDSLGDVAHRLKQDLLEVTRRFDLRVIDCSKNATDGLLRENRHILALLAEVPTWSWVETLAIVDRVEDGINMVIEYNGTLRKVRSVSNVVLSFMKPEDRIGAEKKLKKKGRGRPQINQKGQGVANGSLSDSDFKNRKKVILRETRETIALGKLIGACTVDN